MHYLLYFYFHNVKEMTLISAGLHNMCHSELNLTSTTLVTLTSNQDIVAYVNVTDGNLSTCCDIDKGHFGISILKFLIPGNRKLRINITTQNMECSNKILYLMREECNPETCIYYTPCSFIANCTMECNYSETSDFLYLYVNSRTDQHNIIPKICEVEMVD